VLAFGDEAETLHRLQQWNGNTSKLNNNNNNKLSKSITTQRFLLGIRNVFPIEENV
jgi:adenosine/AMP kinase